MNSIETLKQELLNQKTAIENKGGHVIVANTNPSPSEITAGIGTISGGVDFTLADATSADVLSGKTFYAGDDVLKTGSFVGMAEEELRALFYTGKTAAYNIYNVTIPENTPYLRDYIFYNCPNPLNITFNEDLEEIGSHMVANNVTNTVTNFNSLTHLHTVGEYGCAYLQGIDLSALPTSLTTLKTGAFADSFGTSSEIVVGSNITSMGNYAFSASQKTYLDNLDISQTSLTTLPSYMVNNIVFDCDLVIPQNVTSIGSSFAYGGSFKTITFHENVTNIATNAFGTISTDSMSVYPTTYMHFKRVTPPTIAYSAIGSKYAHAGFNIFVPDQSVAAYKAVSYLSSFKSYIKGESEMP
ncbi:MAG: leucine-rich repeat domain-containing protein [Clostridia bacterium]|nr:leucine-rich repeat domain-containing protein [Clostridia bacterium]